MEVGAGVSEGVLMGRRSRWKSKNTALEATAIQFGLKTWIS